MQWLINNKNQSMSKTPYSVENLLSTDSNSGESCKSDITAGHVSCSICWRAYDLLLTSRRESIQYRFREGEQIFSSIEFAGPRNIQKWNKKRIFLTLNRNLTHAFWLELATSYVESLISTKYADEVKITCLMTIKPAARVIMAKHEIFSSETHPVLSTA